MRAINSWPGELARKLPRLGRPYPPRVIDTVWTVFALVNLDLMFMFPSWETIPFHLIWASLTLIYGFRTWNLGPTLWVASAVLVLTAVGIAVDVAVGSEPATELTEDPLLALMFLAMAWHARRKLAAERSHRLISEHNARLLGRPAAVPAGRRAPAADPDHDRARPRRAARQPPSTASRRPRTSTSSSAS